MKRCPICLTEYPDSARTCDVHKANLQPVGGGAEGLLGQVLAGRYYLHEKLGGGGFGDVYLATDLQLVSMNPAQPRTPADLPPSEALKVIHPRFQDGDMVARFRQEASLLRTLGSRSGRIVTLYNFGRDDERELWFYTMELIEGMTLRQLLLTRGVPDVPRAIRITREVCAALIVAHEVRVDRDQTGVIHRDLKLDNVMVIPDGDEEHIRVLDFGIAKVLGSKTTSNLAFMSPGFAPPEQWAPWIGRIGAATDLFALGVILFYLVTGRDPWIGMPLQHPRSQEEEDEYQRCWREARPKSLTSIRRDAPARLEAILTQLLQKDPAARIQSARELDALLADLESAGQVSPDTPGQPATKLPTTVLAGGPPAVLEITSEPPGAGARVHSMAISSDGELTFEGHTPATVNLRPGRYRVELEKPGHDPAVEELDLGPAERRLVRLTLRAAPVSSGAPAGAPHARAAFSASTGEHTVWSELSSIPAQRWVLYVLVFLVGLLLLESKSPRVERTFPMRTAPPQPATVAQANPTSAVPPDTAATREAGRNVTDTSFFDRYGESRARPETSDFVLPALDVRSGALRVEARISSWEDLYQRPLPVLIEGDTVAVVIWVSWLLRGPDADSSWGMRDYNCSANFRPESVLFNPMFYGLTEVPPLPDPPPALKRFTYRLILGSVRRWELRATCRGGGLFGTLVRPVSVAPRIGLLPH